MNSNYNMRVAVCRKTITGRTAANESIEEWPETKRYSAKRLALNAGEEIRLGVKEGADYLKLEFVGQKIDILYADRIRVVATGRMYRITSEPIRQERTTVVTCENLPPS